MLQTHYVNVETMALERDEVDEVHDCTGERMDGWGGCENPVLQTHYVNVEAIALERDEVDEVHDCTGERMDG